MMEDVSILDTERFSDHFSPEPDFQKKNCQELI
jgi:hypothetical protein